jgi:hypothetical protein
MALRVKRLVREKAKVVEAVASGDLMDAVWAENLEKVEASEMLNIK